MGVLELPPEKAWGHAPLEAREMLIWEPYGMVLPSSASYISSYNSQCTLEKIIYCEETKLYSRFYLFFNESSNIEVPVVFNDRCIGIIDQRRRHYIYLKNFSYF